MVAVSYRPVSGASESKWRNYIRSPVKGQGSDGIPNNSVSKPGVQYVDSQGQVQKVWVRETLFHSHALESGSKSGKILESFSSEKWRRCATLNCESMCREQTDDIRTRFKIDIKSSSKYSTSKSFCRWLVLFFKSPTPPISQILCALYHTTFLSHTHILLLN